jgi:histidine triad (HIT) family protein
MPVVGWSWAKRVLRPCLRTRWAGWVIAWGVRRMSLALPVRRLRETDTLLAFYHPRPAYPLHVLIVPKRACPSLMQLTAQDAAFLTDLMTTVQSLVAELGLEQRGYRLVANGGSNQDVGQLHFHLIAEG